VYTPFVAIVPVDGFPAGMPFTLQLTFVLGVFVTVLSTRGSLALQYISFLPRSA
jgi:hypothetical protein